MSRALAISMHVGSSFDPQYTHVSLFLSFSRYLSAFLALSRSLSFYPALSFSLSFFACSCLSLSLSSLPSALSSLLSPLFALLFFSLWLSVSLPLALTLSLSHRQTETLHPPRKLHMGVPENGGTLFGGPYNKDPSI